MSASSTTFNDGSQYQDSQDTARGSGNLTTIESPSINDGTAAIDFFQATLKNIDTDTTVDLCKEAIIVTCMFDHITEVDRIMVVSSGEIDQLLSKVKSLLSTADQSRTANSSEASESTLKSLSTYIDDQIEKREGTVPSSPSTEALFRVVPYARPKVLSEEVLAEELTEEYTEELRSRLGAVRHHAKSLDESLERSFRHVNEDMSREEIPPTHWVGLMDERDDLSPDRSMLEGIRQEVIDSVTEAIKRMNKRLEKRKLLSRQGESDLAAPITEPKGPEKGKKRKMQSIGESLVER